MGETGVLAGRGRPSSGEGPGIRLARAALAAVFLAGGLAHLLWPSVYRPIMPSMLPAPGALILISGLAEIAGGAGLLIAGSRRAAGLGLIVLLIAVFPANVRMLTLSRARGVAPWYEAILWVRLPLQAVLIWWAWYVSRTGANTREVTP